MRFITTFALAFDYFAHKIAWDELKAPNVPPLYPRSHELLGCFLIRKQKTKINK